MPPTEPPIKSPIKLCKKKESTISDSYSYSTIIKKKKHVLLLLFFILVYVVCVFIRNVNKIRV